MAIILSRTPPGAVLAPGYGGNSQQPILQALARALDTRGIVARPISFSRAKPHGDYTSEQDDIRRAWAELLGNGSQQVALIGRSFGGRMCVRVAAEEPPSALVVLGHPISPPNRPRPDDEAALEEVRCPTLIVQGSRDALGPLDMLWRIASMNRNIDIVVLDGVGHQFGPRQAEGVQRAAAWLAGRFGC